MNERVLLAFTRRIVTEVLDPMQTELATISECLAEAGPQDDVTAAQQILANLVGTVDLIRNELYTINEEAPKRLTQLFLQGVRAELEPINARLAALEETVALHAEQIRRFEHPGERMADKCSTQTGSFSH